MQIKIAALVVNSEGNIEFITETLEVSSEQYENGEHHDLMEQAATDEGYLFVKSFDENDSAVQQLDSLKSFFIPDQVDATSLVKDAVAAGATINTFAQVVGEAFGSSAFAIAAEDIKNCSSFSGDDVEFDDHVVLSRSYAGALVSAWVWVANDAAGIPDVVEKLVPDMIEHLESVVFEQADYKHPVSTDQITFVSDLFENEADTLHNLAGKTYEPVLSRLIFDGEQVEKKLSEVIKEVAAMAAESGFAPILVETLCLWLEEYGSELDRSLAVNQY